MLGFAHEKGMVRGKLVYKLHCFVSRSVGKSEINELLERLEAALSHHVGKSSLYKDTLFIKIYAVIFFHVGNKTVKIIVCKLKHFQTPPISQQ